MPGVLFEQVFYYTAEGLLLLLFDPILK